MTRTIQPKEADILLKSGAAVLIDVREPDEFKAEHIAYALSIPLSRFESEFKALDIPQDRKILFQCLKGRRGEQACMHVVQNGICPNEILNIEGGIEKWKEEGLVVVGGEKGPVMSIFRQVQIIVGSLVALSVCVGLSGVTAAFFLAGILGAALAFAGLTGWCGLAFLLARMPWNR